MKGEWPLKVFYSKDFRGECDTGMVAVVIARHKPHAERLIINERKRLELQETYFTVQELTFKDAACILLQDGEVLGKE